MHIDIVTPNLINSFTPHDLSIHQEKPIRQPIHNICVHLLQIFFFCVVESAGSDANSDSGSAFRHWKSFKGGISQDHAVEKVEVEIEGCMGRVVSSFESLVMEKSKQLSHEDCFWGRKSPIMTREMESLKEAGRFGPHKSKRRQSKEAPCAQTTSAS